MLRVLGHERRLCAGLTRRDLLQAGSLGICGLSLPQLLAAQEKLAAAGAAESKTFGRAKRCIVLYLYGAPSQLETVDMKPLAPIEVRGTMKPIPSSLPGLDVCELLPNFAKVMDRTTVVRSMTHPYPIHGIAYAMTGIPATDVPKELNPRDPAHHPYFGSALAYLDAQHGRKLPTGVPHNIALPFPLSTQRTGEVHRAGPYAGFLSSQWDPVWTEFVGKADRSVKKLLREMHVDVADPYVGCQPDSHFRFNDTTTAEITVDRQQRRQSLLSQFEQSRRDLAASAAGQSWNRQQAAAYDLLSSTKIGEALDVRRESEAMKDSYGRTLFGQACLAGRRLLESGARLVSVFWDEYGLAGDAWDTHWNHFPRMTDQLLPGLDKAYAGLIADLDQRGMLDDTLVVCISCHGRTPKINSAAGGGRDHWSQAYSALFAGGGVRRGHVIGATDKQAAEVTERPVSPKDALATMYHLLGVSHESYLPNALGRPVPLLPEGASVVGEMLI